jgi:hypothetical protein
MTQTPLSYRLFFIGRFESFSECGPISEQCKNNYPPIIQKTLYDNCQPHYPMSPLQESHLYYRNQLWDIPTRCIQTLKEIKWDILFQQGSDSSADLKCARRARHISNLHWYKDSGEQIPSHSLKSECDRYVSENLIYGCGKPFRVNVLQDILVVEICEYV